METMLKRMLAMVLEEKTDAFQAAQQSTAPQPMHMPDTEDDAGMEVDPHLSLSKIPELVGKVAAKLNTFVSVHVNVNAPPTPWRCLYDVCIIFV